MTPDRPQIGHLTLLVYRECKNGHWLATGEGSLAPTCHCGEPAYPIGTQVLEDGRPRFGDSLIEQRRTRGLGFIGLFTNEIGAVHAISRIHRFLGIDQARMHHDRFHSPPYAAKGEVEVEVDDS